MKLNLTAHGGVKRISGNDMTHDELLAKIDKQLRDFVPMGTKAIPLSVDRFMFALRAVVELHKPWDVETEGGTFTLCNDCSRRVDLPGYGILYPCKTIQAIEKELA